MKFPLYISILLMFLSCSDKAELTNLKKEWNQVLNKSSESEQMIDSSEVSSKTVEAKPTTDFKTGNLRNDLVEFSKQFIGTPYSFACATPEEGFDCSGFITYVFNHYGFEVPRSSKDFEFFGREIPVNESKKGDLVLFTGTEEGTTEIGHIGILINENGMNSDFIHSSSGKANGVTISSLGSDHYTNRFVKVISIID